jgi:hypothetical protein
MECLNWDWDRQTVRIVSRSRVSRAVSTLVLILLLRLQAWYQGKSNSLSLSKDGDMIYYKDAREQPIEMSEEEKAAARKRATIEQRKRQQAKTSKRDGPELGVVMRVARGEGARSAGEEDEAGRGEDPPVVGLVENGTATDGVVQVAAPVVEADDHRAEVRVFCVQLNLNRPSADCCECCGH